MFATGQRIICIDAKTDVDMIVPCATQFPVEGGVYTIQAIYHNLIYNGDKSEKNAFVILVELKNEVCACYRLGLTPLGFLAKRFAIEQSKTLDELKEIISKPIKILEGV